VEPECLIPLAVPGVRHAVLVGDHQQLSPEIMSRKGQKKGFKRSMFERLRGQPDLPFMLDTQYRMHPVLSEFSSRRFYGGNLKNGVCEQDRVLPQLAGFPWPDVTRPQMFWHSEGVEETRGTSFMNRSGFANLMEAERIVRIVEELLRVGILPDQIGIVTPYAAQLALIRVRFFSWESFRKMFRSDFLESTLRSPSFKCVARQGCQRGCVPGLISRSFPVFSRRFVQGSEKDIMLISCVRSRAHATNYNDSIGFVNNERRLNVAITRA
ncbi:unnamed protein product, partial [Sphagnum balticum]